MTALNSKDDTRAHGSNGGEPTHNWLVPDGTRWTATLDRLAGLLADGTLRMPIQASYPLAQVDQALKDLGGQHTQGKLAITVA